MTRSLVEYILHSRKSFPQNLSISKRLGVNMILLGKPSPDFKMNGIFFVSYAMVYIGTTNTSERRSILSIALRESNEVGGNFFM